jgi:hypothetical protein
MNMSGSGKPVELAAGTPLGNFTTGSLRKVI